MTPRRPFPDPESTSLLLFIYLFPARTWYKDIALKPTNQEFCALETEFEDSS